MEEDRGICIPNCPKLIFSNVPGLNQIQANILCSVLVSMFRLSPNVLSFKNWSDSFIRTSSYEIKSLKRRKIRFIKEYGIDVR